MLIDHDDLQTKLQSMPRNSVIVGIDEVGRGPLLGDVVAAAVALPVSVEVYGEGDAFWSTITDSKKLSEKKRDAMVGHIQQHASGYALGRATPEEIDQLNILQASLLAMSRAYEALIESWQGQPRLAVVDGRHTPKLDSPTYAVIKGDLHIKAIGAASILAKVARDQEMLALDKQYPGYGIAQHKGYPTKLHLEALSQLGPTSIHRHSFGPVKRLLETV